MLLPEDEILLSRHYKKNRAKLLSYIKTRIRCRDDAEDLLQDVYFRAAGNISYERNKIKNLDAWIWSILKNRLIDYYRHEETARIIESCCDLQFTSQGEGFCSPEDFLADTELNPEESFLKSELRAVIYECLSKMSPIIRDAFIDNVLYGETFKDMADRLSRSINTVLARKYYAKIKLRKTLQEAYPDYTDFFSN